MKSTGNKAWAGLNSRFSLAMGGDSGDRVATRVATQLLFILLHLTIIFILVATVATKKTYLHARDIFKNFGTRIFLLSPMHGYMCFGGDSGDKGQNCTYLYSIQPLSCRHFCRHSVAVVATNSAKGLENMTHPTQQPEIQPEIAFLQAWRDCSLDLRQDRWRAVELLRMAYAAGFPFPADCERYPDADCRRYRAAAYLASWLRENSGVEFEIGAVTLRVEKPRIEEGVQWFTLAGRGQSRSDSGMAIAEAESTLGEREGEDARES